MNGLFGSTILDVAVGLIFVYLLLAIICTSLNEWIASIFKLRAGNLKLGIQQLLDQQPSGTNPADTKWLIGEFYKHPLVTGMVKKAGDHPSYIPAGTFASILIDIVSGEKSAPTFQSLQAGINNLPDGDVKRTLTTLLRTGGADLAQAQKSIETWFNDTMDRVSGWYKRKVQWITVFVALLLAVGTNADTLRIVGTLWHNPELRAEGVKLAEQRAQTAKTDPQPVAPQEQQFLTQLLGWQAPLQFKAGAEDASILLAILGWVLTGIAVSLGAPFWFDMLNKVINIRSSGKAPAESAKAPSEAVARAKAASAT